MYKYNNKKNICAVISFHYTFNIYESARWGKKKKKTEWC